jgi:hypothetical protein
VATYQGGERIEWAQAMLILHSITSADGMCLACRTTGPCDERRLAIAIFQRSLRLPRRVPGATRPELINARRVASLVRWQSGALAGQPR